LLLGSKKLQDIDLQLRSDTPGMQLHDSYPMRAIQQMFEFIKTGGTSQNPYLYNSGNLSNPDKPVFGQPGYKLPLDSLKQ